MACSGCVAVYVIILYFVVKDFIIFLWEIFCQKNSYNDLKYKALCFISQNCKLEIRIWSRKVQQNYAVTTLWYHSTLVSRMHTTFEFTPAYANKMIVISFMSTFQPYKI